MQTPEPFYRAAPPKPAADVMVTAATPSLSALLGQYLITALQPLIINGSTNQLLDKLLGNDSMNIAGIGGRCC